MSSSAARSAPAAPAASLMSYVATLGIATRAAIRCVEEDAGRSLILSRTSPGERLLGQAIAASYVTDEPLDVSEIEAMQPGQRWRKQVALSRLPAITMLGRPPPRFRGFRTVRSALSGGLGLSARNFLGMARRLARPVFRRKRVALARKQMGS